MYKSVIVGVGFIGAMHIDALRRQRNLEIVALCDSFNAEEKAKQYGIKQWFSNYIEMFEKMKPDVVHICTPNSTHYDIAKSAIERGINFICEKPFTTTIEQAIELEAMAKEKGIKGFVNFHSRYYPMIREVREMIKAGSWEISLLSMVSISRIGFSMIPIIHGGLKVKKLVKQGQ